MPLPGGPANKMGNRYENWWTVAQLVRILDGEAESIRFEVPTVDKAEFVLDVGDCQELHQAKHSHPSGKWSLASLKREDLLQAMFDQLRSDSDRQFVFVSGSDAPELRELTERARYAESPEQFQTSFLRDKTNKDHFENLKKLTGETEDTRAYSVLRRIVVRTTDEGMLQEHVQGCLKARFLDNPDSVCDALRSFVEDCIHRPISQDMLISYLDNRGFNSRQLSSSDDAPALVNKVTDRYLSSARRRLICDPLIPRSTTCELLAKISNQANGAAECILTGKAGGGKTACVIECVDALRQRPQRVMVLALRLDTQPVSSTRALGDLLGLEESPALVLAMAAATESTEAVLLIDQLDSVSTTSGRNPEFLDVVADLVSEVRGLSSKAKIHIVLVCREFDWDNDHRLRPLLARDASQFTVADFCEDEVGEVLAARGFRTEMFDDNQQELLCLPQNLKMFLDAHQEPGCQSAFSSAKDLFDLYWKAKRRAVNARASSETDCWNSVIQTLCQEMSASQQLSVLEEKLDNFPPIYLDSMVSEGVLALVDGRYSFGHESFFDYCFARDFVTQKATLTEFLLASEQHLFLRAQVRQILAYLRADDPKRYNRELCALLAEREIRPHLKDLALAWVFSLPDPRESEWHVLAPWIQSELEALQNGRPNPKKQTSLVWNHFFASQSWFQVADYKGLVASWLGADNDRLVDMGVQYVRVHRRHGEDRVAALLEPFIGRNGQWPQRLRFIMEWAPLEHSRELFTLFLKLLDAGTLDPIASNSTFWYMFCNLETEYPDWIAEVLAHWLRRQLSIARKGRNGAEQPNWHALSHYDREGSKVIEGSADRAPEAFVQHVLPAVLDIADEASSQDNSPAPRRDAVWGTLFRDYDSSVDQACLNALATAVGQLAECRTEGIEDILGNLRQRTTYTANFILLRAYAAGARHFADEAAAVLCQAPWRFACGYSNSPYWVSTRLVGAIVCHCTDTNRERLEQTILTYTPPYERSPNGYKQRGWASFGLLTGIPTEFRSRDAQARFQELERKFGIPPSPPERMRSGWIGSPIPESDTEKMTDEQWLGAIQKYDSEQSKDPWKHPEKGGALQLARTLENRVKQEPERFARLSLRFPPGTHACYMEHVLRGLKATGGAAKLKLEVCRKASDEFRETCGAALADLLGSMDVPLPDEAVQMLAWLATSHPDPDPEEELWSAQGPVGTSDDGRDILDHGFNTTRGRAALAMGHLIQRDVSYLPRFRSTIQQVVHDNSVAVQACAGATLRAIVNTEPEFALEQFHRLVQPRGDPNRDDPLLVTKYIERFVRYGIPLYFEHLRSVIERMLRSPHAQTSETGALLASIAVLREQDDAEILVEEACRGNPSQRLGVAKVAAANIGQAQYQSWSEQKLRSSFDDGDSQIRQVAAGCFRNLASQSLEPYADLIGQFCDSAAYHEDSSSLLRSLDQSSYKLPGITLIACEKFLARFGAEAKDIRTYRYIDGATVAKLILRTYHQHRDDGWAARCLDLIDRMCLEQVSEMRANLDKYER